MLPTPIQADKQFWNHPWLLSFSQIHTYYVRPPQLHLQSLSSTGTLLHKQPETGYDLELSAALLAPGQTSLPATNNKETVWETTQSMGLWVTCPCWLTVSIVLGKGRDTEDSSDQMLLFSHWAVIAWTVACQTPLSMGFPRQEYWNGLPFPSPGDLPNPRMGSAYPALAGRFFTTEPPGKANLISNYRQNNHRQNISQQWTTMKKDLEVDDVLWEPHLKAESILN